MSENKKSFTLVRLAQHIGADIVGPFGSSVTDEVNVDLTIVNGLGSLGKAAKGE